MDELIFETTEEYYHKIRVLFAGRCFHKPKDGKFLIKPIGYASDKLIRDWIAKQDAAKENVK